jgi:hypothetical protein
MGLQHLAALLNRRYNSRHGSYDPRRFKRKPAKGPSHRPDFWPLRAGGASLLGTMQDGRPAAHVAVTYLCSGSCQVAICWICGLFRGAFLFAANIECPLKIVSARWSRCPVVVQGQATPSLAYLRPQQLACRGQGRPVGASRRDRSAAEGLDADTSAATNPEMDVRIRWRRAGVSRSFAMRAEDGGRPSGFRPGAPPGCWGRGRGRGRRYRPHVGAQTYLGARAGTGRPGHMMIDGGYPRQIWCARPLALYGTSSGNAGDSYELELAARDHQCGGAGGRA